MLVNGTDLKNETGFKMNSYKRVGRRQQGFTLIEAMIAFAVAAVGLLAVTSLQIDLISTSSESKARAEALVLAQQKIEEFKNYADSSQSDLFSGTLVDNADSTDEPINGTNATFARDYVISTSGEVKLVEVRVGWTDAKGISQQVSLNTHITWLSPRALATELDQADEPKVPSATGRAHLGDGTYTADQGGDTIIDNDDTTRTFDEGNDRKLVACGNDDCDTGDAIVLTLEDACALEGQDCIDFVQIKGTIYIDKDTRTGPAALLGNSVYLKASDAAYCQRYFTDPSDGTTVKAVDANTTEASLPVTANEDYTYFNYTCYLGGGWHGNIGIILGDGNDTKDKFCQGDPYETADLTKPVIANRRAYRGMLHETCTVGEANCSASGITTKTVDGTTTTRYWSKGISDGASLTGHDYVIAYHTSATLGEFCTGSNFDVTTGMDDGGGTYGQDGPMTRGDSATLDLVGDATLDKGSLFRGNPADFYCLNQTEGHIVGSDCVVGAAGSGETACYPNLDTFTSPNAADYSCPYDPTDPPNYIYTIDGTISATVINLTLNDLDTLLVSTNSGDCTFSDADLTTADLGNGRTKYETTYSCEIYAWGAPEWEGYVNVTESEDYFSCSPTSTTYADAGSTDYPNPDYSTQLTASIDSNSTTPSPTIVCEEGVRFTISGAITYDSPSNNVLNDVPPNEEISMIADAVYGGNGECTIITDTTPNPDTQVYTCTSGLMDPQGPNTWSGAIAITNYVAANDYCYMGAGIATLAPGTLFTSGPPQQINYSGVDATINHVNEDIYVDTDTTCPVP